MQIINDILYRHSDDQAGLLKILSCIFKHTPIDVWIVFDSNDTIKLASLDREWCEHYMNANHFQNWMMLERRDFLK